MLRNLLLLIIAVLAAILAVHGGVDLVKTHPMKMEKYDVCLINMKSAKRRLAMFKQNYALTDISKTHSLIRIPGIDGKQIPNIAELLSPKALNEVLTAERAGHRVKHYQLTRGAIGCYQSHVKAWTALLETDNSAALMFEDDAVMVADIGARISELEVPDDFDILLLGYYCNKCADDKRIGMKRVTKFYGLHSYFVSRKFVEKFLRSPESKTISKQIDAQLSDMAAAGRIRVYAVPDQLAFQNNQEHGTSIQMPIKPTEGVDVWE